jgi:catechol 2,3-dioxygenase-like lactoylglutathione lyase family enzyme
MVIDAVSALLLISDDAARLADFYRDALGFPLVDEVHEGVPVHYGCEIGGVHFAIHPSADWPGAHAPNAQSPVLVFSTLDVESVFRRLVDNGVQATPPFDHGFATLTAFRDPDGNNIQVMTPAE